MTCQVAKRSSGVSTTQWFHIDRFWIIPENILIEKGYITNENKIGKKIIKFTINYTSLTEWLKNYEYNYNDIDITKIK